ncbi:PilZ domain-containing protein [Candidatus Omnitrophota bacterium]
MMERRRYPRFQLKVDAKYKIMSSEEVFKLGATRNVSAEGICFESGKKFDRGAHVNLGIDLGDNIGPVSIVGEIKWSSEIKGADVREKRYINGLKLINIARSDEGRFLKYYCDRMVEKLADYLEM